MPGLILSNWFPYALINAEELGVTQANVEEMKTSENINVLRLLGAEGDWGYTDLGLDAGCACQCHRGSWQLW